MIAAAVSDPLHETMRVAAAPAMARSGLARAVGILAVAFGPAVAPAAAASDPAHRRTLGDVAPETPVAVVAVVVVVVVAVVAVVAVVTAVFVGVTGLSDPRHRTILNAVVAP